MKTARVAGDKSPGYGTAPDKSGLLAEAKRDRLSEAASAAEPGLPGAFNSTGIHARLITVALLLLVLASCGTPTPQRMTVGAQLPEFSLMSLEGLSVESGSLAGRPMVLNFWATWCQPCLKEIPELIELANDGVAVVGIALDQEGERVVGPFAEKHAMEYPLLLGDQEVFQRMGGLGIPYTLLLDPAQKVVAIYRGPASRAEIEEDLEKIEPAP